MSDFTSAQLLIPVFFLLLPTPPYRNGSSSSEIGQLGSSTRAEIAGGIAALLQPIPVHIGTDSEAFVSKASQILVDPETQPRKPFALQRDGDLWQIFSQLVSDTGSNSTAISWRKAHATLHAVASGKVKGEDAGPCLLGRISGASGMRPSRARGTPCLP